MNTDDGATLTGPATEERLRAGDLIAELNSRARRIGLNTTDWPGLTMYRFEAPVVPQWSEVHAWLAGHLGEAAVELNLRAKNALDPLAILNPGRSSEGAVPARPHP